MIYIIKDTPIRKNGKTYGVGEEYPYSDKDSKLLWNLTVVKEDTPKDGPTEKKVEAKKPTTEKKVVDKNLPAKSSKAGKTNSKK